VETLLNQEKPRLNNNLGVWVSKGT